MALALRAFPKRFRAEHGRVISATFQDAAAAGDPRVFGLLAIIDVVIAGWRERLRTRPPTRVFLSYRFLNHRLPAQWHRWMLDDVAGWVGLRTGLIQACTIWPMVAVFSMAVFTIRPDELFDTLGWGYFAGMLGYVLISAAITNRVRRRILRQNGFTEAGLWSEPN